MENKADVPADGGYDYQFVETPPDMFICKICHFPSRKPYLSECCGHTFCKSCIDRAKSVVIFSCPCPVCRSQEFKLVHNKQNERVIKSLHIFCTNREKGCKWQGEVSSIDGHLESNDGCPYEEVFCSNHCGELLQRKYLSDHLSNECTHRKVNCQYCHITDELQYIKGSHVEKCPKFPLPCPNNCGISDIPRKDIEDHREFCPLEEVGCPNDCKSLCKREHLQIHVERECLRRKVDCQYCGITDEVQCIEGSHLEKCPRFPLPCPNGCQISNIPREDMASHKEKCPLEEIECPNNCGLSIRRQCLQLHNENNCPCRIVDCQYCHLSDKVRYIQHSHLDDCPKFPLPCPNNCGLSDIPREDVDDHRKVCPLEDVECPNHCMESFQRQCLQSHIENKCPHREVNCQYCQATGEQHLIQGQHVELCPKFPLICPNKCEAGTILREDMETHKNECPLEMVWCRYHAIGCKVTIARKDLQKHNQEKMEEHLFLTMSELVTTKQQLVSTTEVLSKVQEKLEVMETLNLEMKLQKTTESIQWALHINSRASTDSDQVLPVIIRLSDFDRRKINDDDWYSHNFFTHECEYKIKLNVVPAGYHQYKGSYLSVYLYLDWMKVHMMINCGGP